MRLRVELIVAGLLACKAPPPPVHPAEPPAAPPPPEVNHLAELEGTPPKKLLAIDWSVQQDPAALWRAIAPTGDDWQQKLDEVPEPIAHDLAIELLGEGNFTCVKPAPATRCTKPIDVPAPAPTAALDDPCLRRVLAMWAIDQLAADDLPRVRDALRAIVAIPPPESQLVASVLKAIPEDAHALRMEMFTAAWAAGQHELVDRDAGRLDYDHLVIAARDLHVAGALEGLPVDDYRAVYLHAIADEQMATAARQQAIVELVATAPDKLPPDLLAALITATRSPDCAVVASAARALDQHGEHRFVPNRPHGASAAAMMRGMCVLASYEQLQRADETSLLRDWVPARGLELVKIAYDPYSDPPQVRTIDLVARQETVLPELDDLVRALRHCRGTSCKSDDREFKFTFASGFLAHLEVIELPTCP